MLQRWQASLEGIDEGPLENRSVRCRCSIKLCDTPSRTFRECIAKLGASRTSLLHSAVPDASASLKRTWTSPAQFLPGHISAKSRSAGLEPTTARCDRQPAPTSLRVDFAPWGPSRLRKAEVDLARCRTSQPTLWERSSTIGGIVTRIKPPSGIPAEVGVCRQNRSHRQSLRSPTHPDSTERGWRLASMFLPLGGLRHRASATREKAAEGSALQGAGSRAVLSFPEGISLLADLPVVESARRLPVRRHGDSLHQIPFGWEDCSFYSAPRYERPGSWVEGMPDGVTTQPVARYRRAPAWR
jgi:hypothetical protein